MDRLIEKTVEGGIMKSKYCTNDVDQRKTGDKCI